MKRLLTAVLLTIFLGTLVFGQDEQDAKTAKLLSEAAKNGTTLPVSTVHNNISVEAVLIPFDDARRIFGREIAKNYAVIELNIGNKSPDSALLIQNVYIDYSRWVLSGIPRGQAPLQTSAGRFDPYQSSTNQAHVASAEYRMVRGQLLDAQNSSWRNRVMNWLTFAGSLAGAYTFSLSETGIIKGITQATSIGIPGLRTALADPTIEQLQRIDDYGFKSNKPINRQGSDIVVCFFPIDRFLTPGFKRLYLKSPALFFAPLEMMVDRTIRGDVADVLGKDLGMPDITQQDRDRLARKFPCYLKLRMNNPNDALDKLTFEQCLTPFGLRPKADKKDELEVFDGSPTFFGDFIFFDYIAQTSLNSVSVTVDGVMTVDTSAFPGKIETAVLEKVAANCDDKTPCFWTDTTVADGVRKGSITGSYLSNGSVVIAEAEKLGITDITTSTASDQGLDFSFKITKPIASGEKLTLTVVKKQPGPNASATKSIESTPKEYVVNYTLGDPKIAYKDGIVVDLNAGTITINGEFLNAKGVDVALDTPSKKKGTKPEVVSVTPKQIVVKIPQDTKPIGCWKATITVEGKTPTTKDFEIAPTVTKAEIDNGKLIVTGTNLDAQDCQPAGLAYQLDTGTLLLIDLSGGTADGTTKITFTLKDAAAAADKTWKLRVRFGGKEINGSPVTLTAKPH